MSASGRPVAPSEAGAVVEGVFVLTGALRLLALLTLSQQSQTAGPSAESSFQPVGDAPLAMRDWAHGFIGLLALGVGALLHYFVLYTPSLIPRWLSGWCLVGAALLVVSTVLAGFTQEFGFTTANTVLDIPIGLQEIVLAVWLIVKGFNTSPSGAASSASPRLSGQPAESMEAHEPGGTLRRAEHAGPSSPRPR